MKKIKHKLMRAAILMILCLSSMTLAFADAGTSNQGTPEPKVITGFRPVITYENANKFYPVLGQTLKDADLEWNKFAVYTDGQNTGNGIENVLEVVPNSGKWLDWYYGGNESPLKFDKDSTIIWPLGADNVYNGSQRAIHVMKLRIKPEYQNQYRFPRKAEGEKSMTEFCQEPTRLMNYTSFSSPSSMSNVINDNEMVFAQEPFKVRHFTFSGDNGVKQVGLPELYSRIGGLSADHKWAGFQNEINDVAKQKGVEFYTLNDGYTFAGIYDSQGARVDNANTYNELVAGLDANNKTGTAVGKYEIKTVPSIIPFEPTDPNAPANPNDRNIDKAIDKIKDHPVQRADYVVIGFKTDGNGSFNGAEAKAYLVKKNTRFKDVPLPELTPKNGYMFSSWSPELMQNTQSVTTDKEFTANFSNEAPTLVVEDKTIKQGEAFNLTSLVVSAKDKEDGDLAKEVKIVSDGDFNKNNVGKYTVTFKVTDKGGASVTKEATVTVKPKGNVKSNTSSNKGHSGNSTAASKARQTSGPETGDNSALPLYGIMALLSGATLLIILRKKLKQQR